MKMRILINASNCKKGGSVQVATSFINELGNYKDFFKDKEVSLCVSNAVHANLMNLNSDLSFAFEYKRFDMNFFKIFSLSALFFFNSRFDLIFNVFGPQYVPSLRSIRIDGFADVGLIEDKSKKNNTFKNKFRHLVKWFFYRNTDAFIVELENVRKKLCTKFSFPKERVYVVENSISSVFLNSDLWSKINLNFENKEALKFGYVASDYPHKNHLILNDVHKKLEKDFGIKVKFFLTLDKISWKKKEKFLKDSCVNVGPIKLSQCPSFYEEMDAVIFPSLMECFSSGPIEALFMKRPLFASDRDFIRETCAEYAFYFNPSSADDIAKCIGSYFKEKRSLNLKEGFFDEGRDHVLKFSSSKKRTEKYIKIIDDLLSDIKKVSV
jgi:glycosyltransferase involved in cell wall biosynthesis